MRGTKGAKPRVPRVDKRGGARAGAGRPPGVPWQEIEREAMAGAPYDEIVGGLDIPPEFLQDAAVQERIKGIVDRGNTKFKLRLRRAIKKRGIDDGSVNSLALMARNNLEWDQQFQGGGQGAPDTAGIGIRIAEVLEKLAKRPPAAAEGPCA